MWDRDRPAAPARLPVTRAIWALALATCATLMVLAVACGSSGPTDDNLAPGAPCDESFTGCRKQAEKWADDAILWPTCLSWTFVDASFDRVDQRPVITVTMKPPALDPLSVVIVRRSAARTSGDVRRTPRGRPYTLSKRTDGSLALALYREGSWEYQVMNSFGNPRQVVAEPILDQLIDSLSTGAR